MSSRLALAFALGLATLLASCVERGARRRPPPPIHGPSYGYGAGPSPTAAPPPGGCRQDADCVLSGRPADGDCCSQLCEPQARTVAAEMQIDERLRSMCTPPPLCPPPAPCPPLSYRAEVRCQNAACVVVRIPR